MKKVFSFFVLFVLGAGISFGVVGCAGREPKSAVTPGMAKKHIYLGKTTQTEVLEVFGPPDLVTHKEGRDVWTYDKISHEIVKRRGFLIISRQQETTRSIMLIIYFDENDTVTDYKLHAAKY